MNAVLGLCFSICQAVKSLQAPFVLALLVLPAWELFLNTEMVAEACMLQQGLSAA